MVGAAGFEPAISCTQNRRDTRLRYAPPKGEHSPIAAKLSIPRGLDAPKSPLHNTPMKPVFFVLCAAAALLCAGCKSLGYNPQSLDNRLTPTGGETTYVRTWQTDPQTGETTPVVQKQPSK